MRLSLSGRILRNTTLNILLVVAICCVIMVYSMQTLTNSILLDSLQPMARQSAKTVEANIHMLADRMMTIAGDARLQPVSDARRAGTETAANEAATRRNRQTVLDEAAEIYELYYIGLYDLSGNRMQDAGGAPERLEGDFFTLLRETDNLTTHSATLFDGKLGVTMGMPVKEGEETALYVVGVYKYDALADVLDNINVGRNGVAYMVNREGAVTGHPDESLVLAGSTLAQLSGGNEESLLRATTGETGATEFRADGTLTLAAFSPIRGTRWALVIQMPKSDYNYLINGAMAVALLVTAVVLAVSIFAVLRLSRSISRPVTAVTGRMTALAGGNLHTESIPVRTGDELEVLSKTLDFTVDSFKQYISDIQQVLTHIADGNLRTDPQVEYRGDFSQIRQSLGTILESLDRTISGLRDSSERLANLSEELNGQSAQLHEASVEQNQSAEALVGEVSNVKTQLSGVSQSSGETRAKAVDITRRIQEANERMRSLSGAMDDIRSTAQEITKIAQVIEDIAFQTSILSLNASIEASHAGEAGKGFAVVAEEVKRLAERSAEAAKNATRMVGDTRTIIQKGVALTSETADSLQSISAVSDEIRSISDRLVVAVQGQERALSTMEERIEVISSIADRNLQNAGGTKQSSGLLAEEASELRAQVDKFMLREGRGQ